MPLEILEGTPSCVGMADGSTMYYRVHRTYYSSMYATSVCLLLGLGRAVSRDGKAVRVRVTYYSLLGPDLAPRPDRPTAQLHVLPHRSMRHRRNKRIRIIRRLQCDNGPLNCP